MNRTGWLVSLVMLGIVLLGGILSRSYRQAEAQPARLPNGRQILAETFTTNSSGAYSTPFVRSDDCYGPFLTLMIDIAGAPSFGPIHGGAKLDVSPDGVDAYDMGNAAPGGDFAPTKRATVTRFVQAPWVRFNGLVYDRSQHGPILNEFAAVPNQPVKLTAWCVTEQPVPLQ